jgi:hypothetical protein
MEKSKKKKEKTKKEQILVRNRDLLEGALATGNVNGDDCKCGGTAQSHEPCSAR